MNFTNKNEISEILVAPEKGGIKRIASDLFGLLVGNFRERSFILIGLCLFSATACSCESRGVMAITQAAWNEVSDRATEATMRTPPRLPRHGEKLGYNKEESVCRLGPEVREFLDSLLRLYREPGLFANRRATYRVLRVSEYLRKLSDRSPTRSPEASIGYEDNFAPQGFFARAGWDGHYRYFGWDYGGNTWHSSLEINIDRNQECVDSRAVEGYLDLYLLTGLNLIHLPAEEYWNRHGVFGRPIAPSLGPQLPNMELYFGGGCLTSVVINGLYNLKEISDVQSVD